MYRRILFPIVSITSVAVAPVATTAWAQQTNAAAARAEKALRARAEEFYKLQAEKKYRQAETFVAADSKDEYYAGKKPEIRGFSLTKVELLDKNTRANVTVKAQMLVVFMGGAQVFDIPSVTTWKLERGQWMMYIDPVAKLRTPFGTIQPGAGEGAGSKLDTTGKAPDLATLQSRVTVDKEAVELTAAAPVQTVTITNGLPGPLTLERDLHVASIQGLSVEIDNPVLNSGEKALVQFRFTGKEPFSDHVILYGLPVNRQIDIQVNAK
jgi:hypothetical protein